MASILGTVGFLCFFLVLVEWRRRFDISPVAIGSVHSTVDVKWSLFGHSKRGTIYAYLLLLAVGLVFTVATVIDVWTTRTFDSRVLAFSLLPLVLAEFFCRKPYTLSICELGLAWQSHSWRYEMVKISTSAGIVTIQAPDRQTRIDLASQPECFKTVHNSLVKLGQIKPN